MSINFTGQLKKRVVNPGGGFRQNRTNLLQQTQKERERRGLERQREKSAATIHRAVTRKLALIQFKLRLANEWTENSLVDGRLSIDSAVFWFNCFFADTYTRNPQANKQLTSLHATLAHSLTSQHTLSPTSKKGLLLTVSETIRHLDIHKDEDLSTLNMLFDIALLLIQLSPPEFIQHVNNVPIIPAITDVGTRLMEDADYSLIPQLTEVAFLYASVDLVAYLHYLSSPWLIGLPQLKVNYKAISQGLQSGVQLPDDYDQRLDILANLVDMCTDYHDEGFIVAVSHVVSGINIPLVSRSELKLEDNEDESATSTRFERKVIHESLNESIKKLYVRDFISAASLVLKGTNLYSILFASLIALKPNLKSTFIIYMIPNVFEPLLDSILSHDVFKRFSTASEDSLFAVPGDFLEEIFVHNIDFIKYDLFLLLELLEYRLIIANDFEIFIHYGFTREKFTALAMFLKKFVFNLIWNARRFLQYPSTTTSKFQLFSELCTRVLSQVYLKDTRLQVLPKNAWLINASRLDSGNLVSSIVLYDQKKNEDGNDSDDENDGSSFVESLNSDTQARLRIYLKAPFFMSFEKRVKIFQSLISLDAEKSGVSGPDLFGFEMFSGRRPRQKAIIRREHVLEDAYENFNTSGQNLKGQLSIGFVNEHGREEGIDGGGLTKEFLTSVVSEGFNGLFVGNYNHELYPNPEISLKYQHRIESEVQLLKLNYIHFMGKIIGKCLYERVLVDVTFAPFFLTKFNSDYKNSFDDLRSLDPELYKNLVKLLTLSEEELASLDLTFSVDERVDNKALSIDLIPKGSMIAVTASNRIKFIHEISDYKLNKLLNLQSTYFLSGLYGIISKDWLGMFNPYELQLLISGENDVNIVDLKANTVYGGYDANDPTILDFWAIVEEMTSEERSLLVKFATSVPRAPLLGFQALNPKFGINNTGGTSDEVARLPTSSTCVNLLRLPNYRNKAMLKEKLLYAIKAGAGFDLG